MLSKLRRFGQPGRPLEAATIPSQMHSAEQNWSRDGSEFLVNKSAVEPDTKLARNLQRAERLGVISGPSPEAQESEQAFSAFPLP